MRKYLLIFAIIIGISSLFAKEICTLTVTTYPPMHCENCEKKIKNFFRFEKGVKRINTDLNSQTVSIIYDAEKTSETKLLEGFSKIDYSVEKVDSIQ